ncbi:MAG: hypothetical protein ACI4AM_05590 [Muribaculaceae bacterium]
MKRIFTSIMIVAAMAIGAHAEVVFYESFNNLKGNGGNDGYFDNSADGTVEVGAEDLTDATLLDNQEGWGDFVKVAICNQCVRIATKKNPGSITTPAFALNGEAATLTFNAAAQLADVTTLHIELIGEGNLQYGEQSGTLISIELPETVEGETVLANQQYAVTITGVAADCQIRFYTESSSAAKQRAYIDEIKVTTGQDGIAAIDADPQQAPAIYTLGGVRISADQAHHGIFIINGKKVRK